MDTRLTGAALALRAALGLTAALAGLDKFFNLLTDWDRYVSPLAQQMLPVPAGAFLAVVGVIELAVGAAILAVAPRIGAYVASAWLTLVAVNLALGGFFDIAVRDVVMAIAAFTLARLVEAGAAETAPAAGRSRRAATA